MHGPIKHAVVSLLLCFKLFYGYTWNWKQILELRAGGPRAVASIWRIGLVQEEDPHQGGKRITCCQSHSSSGDWHGKGSISVCQPSSPILCPFGLKWASQKPFDVSRSPPPTSQWCHTSGQAPTALGKSSAHPSKYRGSCWDGSPLTNHVTLGPSTSKARPAENSLVNFGSISY